MRFYKIGQASMDIDDCIQEAVQHTMTTNSVPPFIMHIRYPISITSLPTELIAEIMSFAIFNADPPVVKTLSSLGRVCRHWRLICLANPRFWSSIEVFRPESAQLSLSRCKESPIDLCTSSRSSLRVRFRSDEYARTTPALVQLLSPYWPQVRSLSFYETDEIDLVVSVLTSPMSGLQVIDLQSEHQQILLWEPPIGLEYSSVHTLKLMQVYIPLELPIFRDMVHLSIVLWSRVRVPPTIESFVAILESSPRLQTLRLDCAGPRLSGRKKHLPPPLKVVVLPHLQDLHLEDTPLNVAYILSHMSIPHSSQVNIICQTQDFAGCLPTLFFSGCTLLSHFLASTYVHMGIANKYQHVLVATKSFGLEIISPDLSMAEQVEKLTAQLPDIILNLIDLISPTSPLKTVFLSFGDNYFLDAAQWWNVITHSNLSEIHSFGILSHGLPLMNFFAALCVCPSSDMEQVPMPLLPRLRFLVLPATEPSYGSVKNLVNYLSWRVHAGIKLESLRISEDRRGYAELFAPLVDQIVWTKRR